MNVDKRYNTSIEDDYEFKIKKVNDLIVLVDKIKRCFENVTAV